MFALVITVIFSPAEQWPVIPGQSRPSFEEHDAIRIKPYRLAYQKSIFTNDISLILDRKSHD